VNLEMLQGSAAASHISNGLSVTAGNKGGL
jgi:hypothetical protein